MMKSDRLEDYDSVQAYLSYIPLLRDLPEELQLRIVKRSVHKVFEKDDIIFDEGDHVHSVMVIRSGRVKLLRYDMDGKEHILDILHDGDAVWDTLFSGDDIFPYSAVALSEVRLCEIEKSLFEQVIKEDTAAAFNLIGILSQKVRASDEKLVLLTIKDPVSRLAQFLLAKDLTCVTPEIYLKLDDIAASIDLRPETVSRAIKELEKENLILRTGQGKIKVLDREGLEEFSNW